MTDAASRKSWQASPPRDSTHTTRPAEEKEKETGNPMTNHMAVWSAVLLTIGLLTTAACTPKTAAEIPGSPPEVQVSTVEQRDVPVYHEWIGTLDGMVNAAIRAEVTGYLLSQNFAEGSFVRKGQLLFEIDPRPFQAALDQAQGQLAMARGQLAQAKAQLAQSKAQLAQSTANQGRTQLDVDKYTPLAKQQAITQQELDNAVQYNVAAKAQIEAGKAGVETATAQIEASNAAVESAQAAVEAAKVNISFTHLSSPIDGIVGQAQVQVGNLVSPSSGVITAVSTLDPIKVNFTVGEQEYLSLTRGGGKDLTNLQLDLILADGSTYPHQGKFSFADRQVNQSTGAIQLTGLFPNPGNRLRPGQYGKVRATTGTSLAALLVPQRAMTELQGSYQVAVVDSANKVSIRTVKAGDRVGSMWIVAEGLKAGERVVAEGVEKARLGMQVSPKPFVEGH
jgi:RND family efflux transporter MFP subunit